MNRLITKMFLKERDKFDEALEKQLAEEEIKIPPDCCIAADVPFRGRWATFHPEKRMDVYHPMSAMRCMEEWKKMNPELVQAEINEPPETEGTESRARFPEVCEESDTDRDITVPVIMESSAIPAG